MSQGVIATRVARPRVGRRRRARPSRPRVRYRPEAAVILSETTCWPRPYGGWFRCREGHLPHLAVIEPRRHWHVVERAGRMRLLGRMRVVYQLGADTAQLAYGVLSKRASQLMLEGWQLDVESSTDSTVTVDLDGTRTIIEVSECWDVQCLASRPPTGLPATDDEARAS